ncbi:MAG: hypothetical protein DRJ43_01220 [Thermoprotei archaeon]|nr:MAG: hypothetical protein DRJ43_01220 [Thermoprotei archaeon]
MGRYRYVVAVVEEDVEPLTAIRRAVLELSGIMGLAAVMPEIVYANERGYVIVRVSRGGLPLLRAALAAYGKCPLRVLKVTGSLRKARSMIQGIEGVGGANRLDANLPDSSAKALS